MYTTEYDRWTQRSSIASATTQRLSVASGTNFLTLPNQSPGYVRQLSPAVSPLGARRVLETNPVKIDKESNNCCHFRNSIQKFSDDTTLHGFKELYYSKSILWKIIWLVIIGGAVVASVLQVYQSVRAAADNPTTTIIQPLTEEIQYPPIKICYIHWIYWVNWTAATRLGFDRIATLYGLSYLSEVVSEEPFNVTLAKSSFQLRMKENSFTKLSQFYRAISCSIPPGIKVMYLDWNRWDKIIDPWTGNLCYIASHIMIQTGLEKLKNVAVDFKNSIELIYDPEFFEPNLDYISLKEDEYYTKAYVLTLLNHDLPAEMDVNITEYIAAPVVNVDGVRVNVIMPSKETYQSQIKITGTVYKWLNTEKRPCTEGNLSKWNKTYVYCEKICYWREERKVCLNISGAVVLNEDTAEKVCTNDIRFLSTQQTVPGNSRTTSFINSSSETYKSCIEQNCSIPCNQWQFTSTVSSLPVPTEFAFVGFPTLLYLEYPAQSSILVVTEIEALTWETIVGNIGGITGLWLGASVISIIQMCYLLCCQTCDEKLSSIGTKKRSLHKGEIYKQNLSQYPTPTLRSTTPTLPRFY